MVLLAQVAPKGACELLVSLEFVVLLLYPFSLHEGIAMFRVYKHCNCNANVPTII